MSASISILIYPGTAIGHAAIDAQRVSDLLRVDVEFGFNGVACLAKPGGSPELLAERQCAEQDRKLKGPFDRKFARSSQ